MASSAQPDKSNLITPIAIIAALVPLVGGVLWYLERNPVDRSAIAGPSAEANDYASNLKLSGFRMQAAESYAGPRLVEIFGNIKNDGKRALGRVDLNCVFTDPAGAAIYRERGTVIKSKLNPGEMRQFRLAFDGVPPNWNQALPQFRIGSIEFAE